MEQDYKDAEAAEAKLEKELKAVKEGLQAAENRAESLQESLAKVTKELNEERAARTEAGEYSLFTDFALKEAGTPCIFKTRFE